jgi:hypothetical protein
VSSTASECWEHLFKVGGAGVVPAAIDFLCNDDGPLEDRDVGAQALAHLSEAHTPREVILDSQRAVDGLVALIANWQGPDGGAVVCLTVKLHYIDCCPRNISLQADDCALISRRTNALC